MKGTMCGLVYNLNIHGLTPLYLLYYYYYLSFTLIITFITPYKNTEDNKRK